MSEIYKYLNKIDYIIGNPPSIEFAEHILNFLNQTGKLSLLLDASLKNITKNISNDYKINEVVYNISEFQGFANKQMILKFSKIKDEKGVKIINYQTKEEYYKNELDLLEGDF